METSISLKFESSPFELDVLSRHISTSSKSPAVNTPSSIASFSSQLEKEKVMKQETAFERVSALKQLMRQEMGPIPVTTPVVSRKKFICEEGQFDFEDDDTLFDPSGVTATTNYSTKSPRGSGKLGKETISRRNLAALRREGSRRTSLTHQTPTVPEKLRRSTSRRKSLDDSLRKQEEVGKSSSNRHLLKAPSTPKSVATASTTASSDHSLILKKIRPPRDTSPSKRRTRSTEGLSSNDVPNRRRSMQHLSPQSKNQRRNSVENSGVKQCQGGRRASMDHMGRTKSTRRMSGFGSHTRNLVSGLTRIGRRNSTGGEKGMGPSPDKQIDIKW